MLWRTSVKRCPIVLQINILLHWFLCLVLALEQKELLGAFDTKAPLLWLATRQRNVALTYDVSLNKSPHDKEKFLWGGYTLFWQRDKEMSRWPMVALWTKVHTTRRSFFEGGMHYLGNTTKKCRVDIWWLPSDKPIWKGCCSYSCSKISWFDLLTFSYTGSDNLKQEVNPVTSNCQYRLANPAVVELGVIMGSPITELLWMALTGGMYLYLGLLLFFLREGQNFK